MTEYEPIELSELCNAGLKVLEGVRPPSVGEQTFHGLPFRIGNPEDPEAPCFIVLEPGDDVDVEVPVGRAGDRIIVAHRRLRAEGEASPPPAGTVAAEYVIRLAGHPP